MMTQGDILQLHITHIAGLGDGVAQHEGHTVFVPFTCAGDHVQAEVVQLAKDGVRARLIAVQTPSPQRQTPPCPHFGVCGGCELQQLAPAAYAEFKHSAALRVAEQLGADAALVQPLFQSGAVTRRRAEAKVAVTDGAVAFGFLAARSHDVIDTPHCQVVEPRIAEAMQQWRAMLSTMKKPSRFTAVQFTAAHNGLDVQVQAEGKLKPADAEALRAYAQTCARLTLNGETLKAGEAEITFGAATVHLPVGSFLQATEPSQQAMTEIVLRHCAGATAVADLYCGSGTFALPLAQAGHRVLAYEGGQEAVTALFNAARRHNLPVSAHQRDLVKQPLCGELQEVDAAVINPPRNGALPQCKALAASAVGKVVMVSCNPATFTRDALALQAGGFTLAELTPIDQFTWSHHLELVGVFTR